MAERECSHCAAQTTKGCQWHLFRRKDKKWAWHLIGENGSDIVATDGGQGYATRQFALLMMEQVRSGTYSNCDAIQEGE